MKSNPFFLQNKSKYTMIKGFWNQINKKHTKYLNLLIFRPLYTCSIDIDGLVDSTITSVPLFETLVK